MTAKEIEDKLFQRYTNGDDFCREVLELLHGLSEQNKKESSESLSYKCAFQDLQRGYEKLCVTCDLYKAQRDEARKATRFFRDLYVSCVGRTYPEEYRLPWEVAE